MRRLWRKSRYLGSGGGGAQIRYEPGLRPKRVRRRPDALTNVAINTSSCPDELFQQAGKDWYLSGRRRLSSLSVFMLG
jgi:hypothetical protein